MSAVAEGEAHSVAHPEGDLAGDGFTVEVGNQPADPAQWDAFVAKSPNVDVVQTAAWAAAKRALGLEANLIVVRRCGAIEGGALLVAKRYGALGAVGYVARGPIVAPNRPSLVERVLLEVERAAKPLGVRHLLVQPPDGRVAPDRVLARRGYVIGAPAVAPTATLAIDLQPQLDRLFARLSSSKRNQVRRGERAGVSIREGNRDDLPYALR